MLVSSQPSEGHLMSEEVRGSEGIPQPLIMEVFMGSLVSCVAVTTLLWTERNLVLFVVLGAPPPYPGQWKNARLHFLPK